MGEIHDRIEVFIHLMEDIVSEKFDDVPITSFRPAVRPSESKVGVQVQSGYCKGTRKMTDDALWSFIDESHLGKQSY